jgi:hypothetical protein
MPIRQSTPPTVWFVPEGRSARIVMDGHIAGELFQHRCVAGIVNPPVRQAFNCLSPD